MSSNEKACHRTYLLRLWREGSVESVEWRCSLEDPATGVRRGFVGVEAMSTFLASIVAPQEPMDDQDATGGARQTEKA